MVGEELSKAHEAVHKIVREDGEDRILNMALYLTRVTQIFQMNGRAFARNLLTVANM
jgi:hypothetical protein